LIHIANSFDIMRLDMFLTFGTDLCLRLSCACEFLRPSSVHLYVTCLVAPGTRCLHPVLVSKFSIFLFSSCSRPLAQIPQKVLLVVESYVFKQCSLASIHINLESRFSFLSVVCISRLRTRSPSFHLSLSSHSPSAGPTRGLRRSEPPSRRA
jgi:hypothetical protein